MKFAWIALSLVASTAVFAGIGCGDDTGSGGSGAASSSSSSSASGTGGMGTGGVGGMGTGGVGGMGTTGSTGTGGAGAYQFCSDCTSNTSGAYTKECKVQVDSCNADPGCAGLLTYAYDNCGYDGCCPLAKAQMDNLSGATLGLYKAVETCVTCGTCKTLCAPDSETFCAKIQAPNPVCP